jgi:hypothetical protein
MADARERFEQVIVGLGQLLAGADNVRYRGFDIKLG